MLCDVHAYFCRETEHKKHEIHAQQDNIIICSYDIGHKGITEPTYIMFFCDNILLMHNTAVPIFFAMNSHPFPMHNTWSTSALSIPDNNNSTVTQSYELDM